MNWYPYDNILTGIMTLSSAANRAGLCYFNSWYLDLATDNRKLDGMRFPMCRYIYYPNLDRVHYLTPSKSNPDLFIPTKERAIVDYIKLQEEYGDEGILIESIQSYLMDYEEDLPKLYEVSDVLGLPRKELDYWLNEAREESDMSMG